MSRISNNLKNCAKKMEYFVRACIGFYECLALCKVK